MATQLKVQSSDNSTPIKRLHTDDATPPSPDQQQDWALRRQSSRSTPFLIGSPKLKDGGLVMEDVLQESIDEFVATGASSLLDPNAILAASKAFIGDSTSSASVDATLHFMERIQQSSTRSVIKYKEDIPVILALISPAEALDRSISSTAATSPIPDFSRVHISNLDALSSSDCRAAKGLSEAISMRNLYQLPIILEGDAILAGYIQPNALPPLMCRIDDPWHPRIIHEEYKPFDVEVTGPSGHQISFPATGVFEVYDGTNTNEGTLFPVIPVTQYYNDLLRLLVIVNDSDVKSVCYRKLEQLDNRYEMHRMYNQEREQASIKAVPHRDFYNIRKVDTHVHHSACMNAKHLLRFIKSLIRREGDTASVIERNGKVLSLKEVFESLNITPYDLSIDLLDVHADHSVFHRFDRFNLKYNPCGNSRLREIFLKTDNYVKGRYLAELTKEVMSDLVANKYQYAEYRISIYGRKYQEWDMLADWFVNFNIYCDHVRWLIQIPRLYKVYKDMKLINNFADIIDNIFRPLFEVTADPSSHPNLHKILTQVVGFDCVDDESVSDTRLPSYIPPNPIEWKSDENPPYSYWSYYVYSNICSLNQFRRSKGFNTFSFRPHSGEAGSIEHLAVTFLLANGINHGILLRKSPVLQYLYYISQIGIAMSPLSNNRIFLEYSRSPFPIYVARGLNVSLSTDDPLMIHMTKEPLIEEYAVASQVWKLSTIDLCELARNSVLQSGFEHEYKAHWIGPQWWLPGPAGNRVESTNVPDIRLQFRHEVLEEHRAFVRDGAQRWNDEKLMSGRMASV